MYLIRLINEKKISGGGAPGPLKSLNRRLLAYRDGDLSQCSWDTTVAMVIVRARAIDGARARVKVELEITIRIG